MAKLKKGQRVRHVGRPDWGVGQLLEDETDAAIRVFFTGADERTMAPGFRDCWRRPKTEPLLRAVPI